MRTFSCFWVSLIGFLSFVVFALFVVPKGNLIFFSITKPLRGNHKTGARDGFQRKRDAPHLAKFTLIRSTEFSPPRTWFVVELEISRLNEIRWWYGGFVWDFSDYAAEIDDFVSEKSISSL